jgi:hypothetical protein
MLDAAPAERYIWGNLHEAEYTVIALAVSAQRDKNLSKAACGAGCMPGTGCDEPRSSDARSTMNMIAAADGTKRSRDVCWPSR